MGNNIAGHILHKNFYIAIGGLMDVLGQSAIDYKKITQGARNLVGDLVTEDKLVANASFKEEDFETAHDEILRTVDDQLFIMAHLVKISAFMPHLIAKFGPKIRYIEEDSKPKAMPKPEWHDSNFCHFDFKAAADIRRHNETHSINKWEIETDIFLKPDVLFQNMSVLIKSGYTSLSTLRHFMSPATEEKRRKDKDRDAFCTLFRNGAEAEANDVLSRLEFQYFSRFGVTLGLCKTTPDVARWLAAERRKPERCIAVIDHFRQIDTKQTLFPGIRLRDQRKRVSVDPDETRQIARDLIGKIPETGVFIGHVLKENIPPRGQPPRLVHTT